MRIGFLYNHEALHQVSHTAPVAAELTRRAGVGVTILTSSAEQLARARALVGDAAARIAFVSLEMGGAAAVADRALRRVLPFGRVATLRRNLDRFAALDVLVVPETTSLLLRDRFGLSDLKIVWIPHGAGDRSVGFRPVVGGFDLVLLSGAKVRDRMLAAGLVERDRQVVIGYPKFDTVDPAAPLPLPPALHGDHPCVLYNPHFDPLLSSWYSVGSDVLAMFAAPRDGSLIFAPHVMLFRRRLHASVEHRRLAWRRDVPPDIGAAPNVLVDPGSTRSVDMSYTRAADIYLGDASSQIYEWCARPRPAIFLNPRRIAWRGDPAFAHWQLGEVVETVDALPEALRRAAQGNPHAERQRAAFAATFSQGDRPASVRAADAIMARYAG